jgi:hypothetical protein
LELPAQNQEDIRGVRNMESVFGIVGKDFVLFAADAKVARSILVYKDDEDKVRCFRGSEEWTQANAMDLGSSSSWTRTRSWSGRARSPTALALASTCRRI